MNVNESDKRILKENLKFLRTVSGLSTNDLGILSNLTNQSISNFETKSEISDQNYVILRSVFDQIALRNRNVKKVMVIIFGEVKLSDDDARKFNICQVLANSIINRTKRTHYHMINDILNGIEIPRQLDPEWIKSVFSDIDSVLKNVDEKMELSDVDKAKVDSMYEEIIEISNRGYSNESK